MRSLLFDFPEDTEATKQENEFMFGPALLICAVTEPMYYGVESVELNKEKTWKCYLPKGTGWYDYWTNQKYDGGQYVTVDAGIDRIPIFVREGSIIPVAEGLMYAEQQPERPVRLMVYPGADGEFLLYEDEGNNYNFEKGAYATTKLKWDEGAYKLTVEPRKGNFPGMREATYETVIVKS